MKPGIFMGIFIVASGFITLQNSNKIDEAARNIEDYDLPEGTYYIRNRGGSHKYLDVSWSCKDEPNCKVQLWSLGNTTTNDKWVIKRAGLPLISPYTMMSVCNNKYLTGIGDDNGDTPDVQARLNIGDDFRGRQEWRFKRESPLADGVGVFKIYNDVTGKYLDAVDNCVSENGCKIHLWTDGANFSTQWYFYKAN